MKTLAEVERDYVCRVLQETGGNQRAASRILGISRWSLNRRLRHWGIDPAACRPGVPGPTEFEVPPPVSA